MSGGQNIAKEDDRAVNKNGQTVYSVYFPTPATTH